MAEYCSQADVKKRATANGWRWIADRNGDGRLNATESAEVDYAIAWSGRQIDVAIAQRLEPSDARSQANDYLSDIAIDLATWRLFSNGGDDVPASIQIAYDDAKDALKRLKGGEQIPGLTYLPPLNSAIPARVPRAYMPR